MVLTSEDFRGTGTKQFPLPLEWPQVEMLCKKYNVDAIVALETFDSDLIALLEAPVLEIKPKMERPLV